MSDYNDLKKRAEAATPGPWIEVDDEDSAAGAVFIVPAADVWKPTICRITAEYDAAFITSANPAVVLELIAENEANKERADAEQESYDGQRRILDAVKTERDQLKAENEALRKDAERYRWLRTHEPLTNEFYQGAQCRELRWGKRLDDLIDAAMSKELKA